MTAANQVIAPYTKPVHKLFGERWYGSDSELQRSKYIFPIDEEELERLDIFHKFFLTVQQDVLFSAPLDTRANLQILDLGTGTGIWPIDVSKSMPQAFVLGVDFNMIQPKMIPATMEPPLELDIESDWGTLKGGWDLIHVRALFGSVGCWEKMYHKIYEYLKPNVGYLEQVEIDWVPRYDDGNVPYKNALIDWTDKLLDAMDQHGRSMRVESEQTRQQLARAGFSYIRESSAKVCFSPWSKDPHEKEVALWFRAGFCRGIKALSYGPMKTYLGMSIRDIDHLCEA
ncbi:methyltransferase LaeA [Pochonia chlamydosporia 170]|uniref:Methyltransferase LaeA n=1 Tax=Pochonia chlamydosporia 170 TaxID=1380566 RepID=A0A219AP54_METCM|nr:methyltransferase LaeA [Pochonia chlamydosporia 170]OWT42606.1 methyltransferase LaeA [Pochonia chlamydosporia 170]